MASISLLNRNPYIVLAATIGLLILLSGCSDVAGSPPTAPQVTATPNIIATSQATVAHNPTATLETPVSEFEMPEKGDTENQKSLPAPSPTPNMPPQSPDSGSVNPSADSPTTLQLGNLSRVPPSPTPSPGPATESSWWTFSIYHIKRSDEYTSTFPPVTIRPAEGHQLLQVSVMIRNISDKRQEGFFILRALWRDEALKIIPFMPRGGPYPFPTGGYVEELGPRIWGIIRLEDAGDPNAEEYRYAMIEIPEEAATEDVILEILAADNPEIVELPVHIQEPE